MLKLLTGVGYFFKLLARLVDYLSAGIETLTTEE